MSIPEDNLEPFVRELTRHQQRLQGFIRCLVFRSSDVDDVWQELNVELWRRGAEFQPGSDFWRWASAVARYCVLNYSRTRGKDRLVFDEALLATMASELEQLTDALEERRRALEQCLETLSSPQRMMLELRYGRESSLERIADQLQRPVGSVRQTLYRIRKGLIECIDRRITREATQ